MCLFALVWLGGWGICMGPFMRKYFPQAEMSTKRTAMAGAPALASVIFPLADRKVHMGGIRPYRHAGGAPLGVYHREGGMGGFGGGRHMGGLNQDTPLSFDWHVVFYGWASTIFQLHTYLL